MSRRLLFTFSFLLFFVLFSKTSDAQSGQQIDRPKLVVGIAVDQMRWDYLYRYYDRYEAGGFKRMLNEGFTVENTFINHLPSYTAVGHTTIFTGSVPSIHGIVGNNWRDQVTGRSWYCTEDTTAKTVGSTSKAGQMSPRNLLVTTVTDELRLATNFRSKVVGVSLKDRASILPAGHAANAAFWFDESNGYFITSDYYMNQLPAWADQFNKNNVGGKLVANDWKTLYPINTYKQSTADNVAWEGLAPEEKAPVFPHPISKIYKNQKGEIRSTPFGNTLTLDFAKAAVEGYDMGTGDFTDFLTINLASTDYVGHRYGPNSIEVEDTYLRLDKDLAAFFSFLDQRLGKNNYTVFLTADHGAAHSIKFMQEHDLPADFFHNSQVRKALAAYLQEHYGNEKLVVGDENWHLRVDKGLIRQLGLDYNQVKADVINFLPTLPGIQFAIDLENLGNSAAPELIKTMSSNGYNPKRVGVIQLIQNSGWFSSGGTGTTHGSWNPVDTHIPLVFMGWGIPHGHTNNTYHMQDIAPTVAALLHIQMGSGNVGKAISEITDR